MSDKFLYEKLDVINDAGFLKPTPEHINSGLAENIVLREYQEEALKYFINYFENDELSKNKQIHTLFHMATGSGKTVIMAGLILYLYTKGYKNFLFFVNQTNILEKTKENFTNPLSSKYLFADELEYLGSKIKINSVSNFEKTVANNDEINICFTTTQKLHLDLMIPKENSLTYKDFEDNKIVFISDESHHVNTMTKNANNDEKADIRSWEYSVMNAFRRNKDNILLEFTATADLKDSNVKAKYTDKIIYNYPLIEFRASGYTKDFQNFATDSSLWERSLMAIIISEYRRYLFADAGVNIKPVVLFKSQRIADSENFYKEFYEKLESLTKEEIDDLYLSEIDELIVALDYFKEKDESFNLLISSLKQGFSEDKAIVMNGSKDNTVEQQLQVNSLEDKDNPIRLIFAVDMLNEGWDVLNLFDIVRLYDTRQGSGKPGKIGTYTIKEAQLIGRGARYCPFQIDDSQERFKRKYDYDTGNKHRILETMYFHSKNDSKYISELRQALISTGMQDEKPLEIKYVLKDSFKETELYKQGYIFANERLPKKRRDVREMEGRIKNAIYTYTASNKPIGVTYNLFVETSYEYSSPNRKRMKFKDIPYNTLRGACERYKELKFSVIKIKYPFVNSLREFLTSEKYLGNSILEIEYYSDSLETKDIYKGLINAFARVSSHIASLKQDFEGSRYFIAKPIRSVIKDKVIHLNQTATTGGRGESQNENSNNILREDLSQEEWYVFNDNYGTDQEKLMVKYFISDIKPKLDGKGLKYYLIRNERIPELAIYSFETGERFEPDFILLIEKSNVSKLNKYQVYIEPKGEQLLLKDKWKEEFLLKIEDNAYVEEDLLTINDDYLILGMPFFNNIERMNEFNNGFEELLEKL